MPQMDVDIRKPVSHSFGIHRPGQSATSTSDDADDDFDSDDEDIQPSTAVVARGGASNGAGGADAEGQTVEVAGNDDYIYDSDDEYDEGYELEEARRAGGLQYYKKLVATKGQALGRGALYVLKALIPAPVLRKWTAASGRRCSLVTVPFTARSSRRLQAKRFTCLCVSSRRYTSQLSERSWAGSNIPSILEPLP
uniref:Uncharacterized protein n=1 Tax=Bionectria ochroleuca TaxID=29856 RepID=A0A8H7TP80_BIOOC